MSDSIGGVVEGKSIEFTGFEAIESLDLSESHIAEELTFEASFDALPPEPGFFKFPTSDLFTISLPRSVRIHKKLKNSRSNKTKPSKRKRKQMHKRRTMQFQGRIKSLEDGAEIELMSEIKKGVEE